MNGTAASLQAERGLFGVSRAPLQSALIRSVEFDFTLIVMTAAWALLAGIAVVYAPSLFVPILVLDVWLLGYQHVVATYTRLVFDTDSFSRYRFLSVGLPVLVAAGTFGAVWWMGSWVVASLYLYWQWFHYTRQSYGISRMYARKVLPAAPTGAALFGVTYLLPLWGILHRSAQQPDTFLGLDLLTLPIPWSLVNVAAVVALVCLAVWLPSEIAAVRRDPARLPYCAYMLSHVAIFTAGYLVIDDINTGWLVLNIWHNLQYLLIVWMFNTNRFKGGVDPAHRFLSTISQPRNVVTYVLVSLACATALYVTIQQGAALVASGVASLTFAIYMTINFHHYIVDAVIWRRGPARKADIPV